MEFVLSRLRVKDLFAAAGFSLAAVVSLPLVGVLILTLRPVMITVLIAGVIVGGLMLAVSGRFRKWLAEEIEPEIHYRGLRLARDIGLHPNHSWARIYPMVVVGADDLVQATLGSVEKVELPSPGQRVQRGETLFTLHHSGRSLAVRSPISGTVVACNDALRRQPDLVNREPFGQGWVVRLFGDNPEADRRLLLRGKRARAWFRREVDRVFGVPAGRAGSSARSGPDRDTGDDSHRVIDESTWKRMTAAMSQDPDPPGSPET